MSARKARSARRCTRCTRAVEGTFRLCAVCREDRRETQEARRLAGFCPDCSAPAVSSRSRCELHAAKRRMAARLEPAGHA